MRTYTAEQFCKDLDEPYAWPGGYPRFFLCSDGECLSFSAAKENKSQIVEAIETNSNDGWRVVGCDINWEDADMLCAHSGERIESAYGEN